MGEGEGDAFVLRLAFLVTHPPPPHTHLPLLNARTGLQALSLQVRVLFVGHVAFAGPGNCLENALLKLHESLRRPVRVRSATP